jgi:hypothetical protein
VSAEVQYYVIGRTGQVGGQVLGVARRTYSADGPVDETLRGDLSWQPDSVLTDQLRARWQRPR